MPIQETIVIELAAAQITDDCRVELRQEKKRTTYTAQQARDLALELIEAAEKVDTEIADDMADRGLRLDAATVRSDDGAVIL